MGCEIGVPMQEEIGNKSFKIDQKETGSQSLDSRYQTLFEQVNAATFLTTLDGKILEANLKSCELLGYSWDELMQLSLVEILSSHTDWSRLIEEISSMGGINREVETRRKDGVYVPVDISTSLFKMEEKPVMLALMQDISERKNAERKLRESEQKYKGLFECTTDGIIVLDAHGMILDVNKRALELFGLEENNVLGNNFLSMGLLTPRSLSTVVKQFEDILSDKVAKSNETQIIAKDGNILDVELNSFFLFKQNNEVDNFVVIIRDISDREQFEIKLAQEREMLHTLINNIPDPIYFKDEKGRFILVNNAKTEQFDIKPEDMIGKTDFDFLPEDQAREVVKDDEELMKMGGFVVDDVRKITDADGSKRWVSVTKIPRFDAEGNIIGIIGISRDITRWEMRKEKLEIKQEK